MSSVHSANPIDAHIGNRIRMRREAMGLSRGELAALAGLSFGEIEAMEDGRLRARAGDLYDLARLLNVKLAFFFECGAGTGAAGSRACEASERRFEPVVPG